MDYEKLMAGIKAKKQSLVRRERAVSFKAGKTRIRVAPGWRPGEEHVWSHDFGQHFIKDAAGEIQAVYVCTDATFGKPCEVCGAVKHAMRAAESDEKSKMIAQAASGKTTLVNAFHLDSEEPNTPKVTQVPSTLLTQLLEIAETQPLEFFDLEKGHDIVVTRTGTNKNDTRYHAQMSIKPGTPIPAAALSKLTNLDEYVAQENEEQQRRAIGAINSIAGVLPAPSAPMTTAGALAAPPTAPITARAAATTAPDPLDTELDDLLGDLPE
jgi:hypothetical protein